MLGDGDARPDGFEIVQVNTGRGEARFVLGLGDHVTPGVDNHRVAPSGPRLVALDMAANLVGRDDIALSLDRAGAQQNLPMVFAGLQSEGRRDHYQLGAGFGQGAVKLAKSQVVANGTADFHLAGVVGHDLCTAGDYVRFAIFLAIGGGDVKAVDLAVARQLGPLPVEGDRGVVEVIAGAFEEAAPVDEDAVFPGHRPEGFVGLAAAFAIARQLLRLGAAVLQGTADHRESLRQGHHIRAVGRDRGIDQAPRLVQIASLVVASIHLNRRNFHPPATSRCGPTRSKGGRTGEGKAARSIEADMVKLVPVILSGGSGTRLWPLSTPDRPKQFLSLVGEQTMLQETAARVADPGLFASPMVVCNATHRFQVAEQMRATGTMPQTIMLEPMGRNTAPAIAVAAQWLVQEDPDAIMLVLPSDHVIADVAAFHTAARMARDAAAVGYLVTFGLKPTQPETGYGYIRMADDAVAPGVRRLGAFVEKPDKSTAEGYLASGDYLWNSGMFVLPAALYLQEVKRLEPEMHTHCAAAVGAAERDADFVRLAAESFGKSPAKSVDHAVMEHTDKAAVVPADIGWSDVGSWASLHDILQKDAQNNATVGNVLHIDAVGCYLRSNGPLLAAVGVSDLAVIATEDAVLIAPRAESQRVREVVDALKERAKA